MRLVLKREREKDTDFYGSFKSGLGQEEFRTLVLEAIVIIQGRIRT